ncbi:MAG: DNA polymerase III subunit gamma/tau [Candidatus Dormibacteria bacterium]
MNSVQQSLYLRYRPQRFGELVGQEVVARTLRNAVRERRFAHAYLFTGIRGTGKTSAARILARAINCETPQDGEPCLSCGACESIGAGRSLDVIEIDAATNRGIDEIRDLRERAQFLPSELRMKVYIIDEAHMLTTEAGNAFLKTLEEPPEHACFILATTEPHRLTETILSRCQRFDFRRIPVAAMAGHLTRICELEGVKTSADVMQLVAEAGAGSLRDAESLLDRLIGTDDGVLDLALVRSALGMADPGALGRLADALVAGDMAPALAELQQLASSGVEPRQLLRSLGATARARHWTALAAAGPNDGFWLELMEACSRGGNDLRRSDDPWMALEVILLKLGAGRHPKGAAAPQPPRSADAREPLSKPDPGPAPPEAAAVESESQPPPDPQPAPGPAPTPDPQPLIATVIAASPEIAPEEREPVGDEGPVPWAEVKEWAQQRHPGPFAALVRETRAASLVEGRLTVEVRYPWHLAQLQGAANRAILEGGCREVLGAELKLELVLLGEAAQEPAPTAGEPSSLALALKHFPGSTVRKVDFHDPSGPPSIGS